DDVLNKNSLQSKPNTASKRGCKKKQETVASSSSQIVHELLNSDDKVANISELSQSSDSILSRQLSPIQELEIESPTLELENMSLPLGSEIPFQETTPSQQLSPILKSRAVPPRRSSSVLGSRTNNLNNFVSSYHLPTNPVVTPLRTSILGSNFLNSLSGLTSNSIAIPSIFSEMTIYQICLWLCANPNVLQLANNINISMQTLAADGSQFMPSISSTLSTMVQNQTDKAQASRDFLEELKCLFLCVRNPPKKVLEELVRQIIKCDLNSTEGIEWLHIAKRHFGDFHNKLINRVEKLIEDFKKKRNRL
ncbi:7366_t:CDS:2, partial [Racocetra fulgida]